MCNCPIAVSSTAFHTNSVEVLFNLGESSSISAIELSGNLGYNEPSKLFTLLKEKAKKARIFIHNYFPTPKEPFVLNLAHPDTCEKSIRHCLKAIDLCSSLGIKVYSVHAGMAINPRPADLGRSQSYCRPIPFEESRNLLIDSCYKIADYAEGKDVQLLIENNVVSKSNCPEEVNVRYHLADPKESEMLLPALSHPNIGILLDVGHLKVSSTTLGFNPYNFIKLLNGKVKAIHLSDNDGDEDQNLSISDESWFWSCISWDQLEYISLELKPYPIQLIKNQLKLIQDKIKKIHSSYKFILSL